jgi:hypothetical protein
MTRENAMRDMDREIGLGRDGDLPLRADYRDRLLMVDEMEETAEAIRAKAVGFDDVAEEQVQRLETALRALRADLSRRGEQALD